MKKHESTMRRRGRALGVLGLAAATVAAVGLAATPGAAAGATSETIFGTSTPAGVKAATDDTAAVELGTSFTAQTGGTVSGVRYYRTATNKGTHTGTLWSSAGTKLATATFANETASGWQTVNFSKPVAVVKGQAFVVSYRAPKGNYAYTSNFSGSSASKSLKIATTNAGRFAYGASSAFPESSYKSTNYWVDAVFTPTTTATPTPSATAAPAPSATATTAPAPAPSPTATTAPSAAMPGATNTGVPVGTTLKASGALRITQAGQVVDGLDITGTVRIDAPNVVIRNSKIHGSGTGDGIQVGNGSVTVYDSEIYGFENGIAYGNWAAYRVNIHSNTGDGVKLGTNTTLQDSWIHDLTPAPGAHADGGQVQDGITNLIVRHNTIDVASSTNSALFISPDFGPTTAGPVLIENNFLDGGGFAIFVVDGNYGQYFIRNITVRNNVFGSKSKFGAARVNVDVTWTGNTNAKGATVGY